MKTALLVFVLAGCSGSTKQREPPATPTEQEAPVELKQPPADAMKEQVVEEQVAPPPEVLSNDDLELPAKPSGSGRETQSQIAWNATRDGIALMKQSKYAEASAKFREAVARVPEAGYFFNACMALFQEGKFGEALTTCNAVENNAPTTKLQGKTDKLRARIRYEASRQGIRLE